MNDTCRLVEYGVPLDAKTMIEPPDVAELELEPGHPGWVMRVMCNGGANFSSCVAVIGCTGAGPAAD